MILRPGEKIVCDTGVMALVLVLKNLKTVHNIQKIAIGIKQKALNIIICNSDYYSLHS